MRSDFSLNNPLGLNLDHIEQRSPDTPVHPHARPHPHEPDRILTLSLQSSQAVGAPRSPTYTTPMAPLTCCSCWTRETGWCLEAPRPAAGSSRRTYESTTDLRCTSTVSRRTATATCSGSSLMDRARTTRSAGTGATSLSRAPRSVFLPNGVTNCAVCFPIRLCRVVREIFFRDHFSLVLFFGFAYRGREGVVNSETSLGPPELPLT